MVSADKVVVSDFMGNIVADPKTYTVDWDASAAEKGGWDSFMDKEIHEGPAAVQRTLLGRLGKDGNLNLDEVRIDEHDFKAIDKIIVIACGTAAYAGMVAKYAIEHWVRIPVEVELAHEFRYRDPILTPRTLVVAISQSGETMDTLMALRHAREQGSKVLAICNTQARPFRVNPTRCCTRTLVRKWRSPPPRRSWRRLLPLRAWLVFGAGQGRDVPRRDRAGVGFPQRHASQDPVGS